MDFQRLPNNLPIPIDDGRSDHLPGKRLTFVIIRGVIEKAFYPVFPPDGNAIEVLGWLANHDKH